MRLLFASLVVGLAAENSELMFTSPNHKCSFRMSDTEAKIVSSCTLHAPGLGGELDTKLTGLEARMSEMAYAMEEVQSHLGKSDSKKWAHDITNALPDQDENATPKPTQHPTKSPTQMCGTSWSRLGEDMSGAKQFGEAMDMSGDGKTVVVGASDDTGARGLRAGSAKVFTFSNGLWTQKGPTFEGAHQDANLGRSVGISDDGHTVAVGEVHGKSAGDYEGNVRVYTWRGGAWVQKGQAIMGTEAGSEFATATDLSDDGNTIAISSIKDVHARGAAMEGKRRRDHTAKDAGKVRIWHFIGTKWIKMGADLNGEAAGDRSGGSDNKVSLSGDGQTVAIGAMYNAGGGEAGSNIGHVRVYRWSLIPSGDWVQLGKDIDGVAGDDFFGSSTSLSQDGNTLAIGAHGSDRSTKDAGAAYVYTWDSTDWIVKGSPIDGEAASDNAGMSVSLSADGSTVAVGAPGNDGGGLNAGHVRVFMWFGSSWMQKGADIDGHVSNDASATTTSLSSDGDTVAIGAPGLRGSFAGKLRVWTTCS
jgi:hypothetical protein